jgi:predicted secreted protein
MSSVFTKSDNEIEVKVGDSFAIELEGNPTTGYDWQLKFDSDTLELLDQHYMQKGGGLGAGRGTTLRTSSY